jgi:glycosyltransferase involved in cell wall biosynthesis/predicted SAM-dependent methyltransferase
MTPFMSLALIVKNEESCLDKCLESFSKIADEIVVVDTGSTDRTKEIARKYTDKIHDFKWIDDFSAARNYSFDKCTGTFIFWCDGDDCIYPEDIEKFKALDLSNKEVVICNYEYAHDEMGNSLMTVPRERIIRTDLFREQGVRWKEPIHEYLPLTKEFNGKSEMCKIFISDISTHHFKKAGSSERNIKILDRIVKKPGCISRNLYYYGRELLDLGGNNIELGIQYMNKFIEKGDGFWEDIYAAHYRLAEVYFGRDEAKFKQHLIKSIEIEERRAEPFYLMAQYWESKGQWLRAAQWYEFCTSVKRPKDLLASYQPGLYTWQPCLQNCLMYNNLGMLQEALDWNNKALKYRPKDDRMLKNKEILERGIIERKYASRQDGQSKKLNLGAGGKREKGFLSIDIFNGPDIDEVFDLDEIPYKDETISAINSEHSLEHVGWQRVDKALLEWWRVLKPGGQLFLKMPDFEDCCKKYLETPPTNKDHRQWYKYTIYGVQKTQAGEPDEAQYHRAGFSQKELNDKLEEIGFISDFSVKYDGWSTPSFFTLCTKPICPLKVGWIAPMNWEAAQTRIRVLHINRWLRSKGFNSSVFENYQDIIDKGIDICIVGKSFDDTNYNNIKYLKDLGKTIIGDLCEDLINFPKVNEILALCDLVVCCSTELAKKVQQVIKVPVEVIEDAYEG